MAEFVKDTTDANEVKLAESKESLLARQQKDDIKAVMELEPGRRFMHRILAQTKVGETIYAADNRVYYNAGQRDLGHWLMAEIGTADYEKFQLMMREAKENP